MSYNEPELNMSGMVPSQSRNIENHSVKPGDNIFRIMPPFGTGHNGLPFAEVYLHWLSDPAGKNRPLLCSKKSERFCPICQSANEVYKEGEAVAREFKDSEGRVNRKAMPEEVGKKYDGLMENFRALKAQHSFLYNAMDTSNTIKILRLPKTAAEDLGRKIVEVINTMGFNPLSLKNGLFFNIKQISTGPKKFNVKYEVETVKKTTKEGNSFVQRVEPSSVPDNVIENFEKLAFDVHTLYPIHTAQELKRVLMGDVKVWAEMDAQRDARKAKSAEAPAAIAITPSQVSAINALIEAAVIPTEAPVKTLQQVADENTATMRGNSTPAPAPKTEEAPKAADPVDDLDDLKRQLGLL